MKVNLSLPKEVVEWLRKRKATTGIPVSRQVADAIRNLMQT